jgi:hypothetical protein
MARGGSATFCREHEQRSANTEDLRTLDLSLGTNALGGSRVKRGRRPKFRVKRATLSISKGPDCAVAKSQLTPWPSNSYARRRLGSLGRWMNEGPDPRESW